MKNLLDKQHVTALETVDATEFRGMQQAIEYSWNDLTKTASKRASDAMTHMIKLAQDSGKEFDASEIPELPPIKGEKLAQSYLSLTNDMINHALQKDNIELVQELYFLVGIYKERTKTCDNIDVTTVAGHANVVDLMPHIEASKTVH